MGVVQVGRVGQVEPGANAAAENGAILQIISFVARLLIAFQKWTVFAFLVMTNVHRFDFEPMIPNAVDEMT